MVVRGTIIGVVGDRGVVKLDSGDLGVVWPELVESGLPADQLFTKGMVVNEITPAEQKRMRDAVRPVYDKHAATIGKETVDRMNAALAKVRGG